MKVNIFFLFWCSTFFSTFSFSFAVDSIAANGFLADGETIVSAGGEFELGFFDPGNSKRYFGIWYKKIPILTPVWVGNRDSPLNDTSGFLKLDTQGTLVLSSEHTNRSLWLSNSSRQGTLNPMARLLDTGNLIITDEENITLWQSFDYLGHTLLQAMEIRTSLVTKQDKHLTAWTSINDPSSSDFTYGIDPHGFPQTFVKRGSHIQFRSGPWNGITFSGMPNLKPNPIYKFEFVYNDTDIYYTYQLTSSVISRMLLDQFGVLQRYVWIDRIKEWNLYLTVPVDTCDRYALCGAYGSCDINKSPSCGCLAGFTPKSLSEWSSGDWSGGCVRKTQLDCGKGDGFLKVRSIKLPDTRNSWFNTSMDLEECKKRCMKNCSCVAYSNIDIRNGGSGCLIWLDELLDIRDYIQEGQDLYIKVSHSELSSISSNAKKRRLKIIIIPTLVAIFIIGFFCIVLLGRVRRKLRKLHDEKDLELPIFHFNAIVNATGNFSEENKIGGGGYGPVYKGKLEDGQEVAVKRLSKDSTQGLEEFKNEIVLFSKLQHRNLVKLLGCCIHGEEKMLIYEYMPNKSLEAFIFGQNKTNIMEWQFRSRIIIGIAQGLLYLHKYSRLRIIHRDLKVENILLDHEMNPKIADFGIAKRFEGDETEAKTERVIGTQGYMSPEYVMDGTYSPKSDVFSFGVILLEIISGRRNRGFNHPNHNLSLVGHAQKLFLEDKSKELIDPSIVESCDMGQVLRFIQVGLLCVQQSPDERPCMSSVVTMLNGGIVLPQPNERGIFTERELLISTGSSSSNIESRSINHLTITALTPR